MIDGLLEGHDITLPHCGGGACVDECRGAVWHGKDAGMPHRQAWIRRCFRAHHGKLSREPACPPSNLQILVIIKAMVRLMLRFRGGSLSKLSGALIEPVSG